MVTLRYRGRAGLLILMLASLGHAEQSSRAPWPQFRGTGASGVAEGATNLPPECDVQKNCLWTAALPAGHSSPCVAGGRIFVTAHDEDANRLETICIDQANGTILWRKAAHFERLEKLHAVNSPAAASPASDGSRVYVYFGSAGLLCYDLEGNEVWSHPLPIPETMFGSASSPALADDLVLLAYQQGGGSLLAVDAATGQTRWHQQSLPFGVGYALPVILRRRGETEILVQGSGGLSSLAMADGSPKWSLPGLAMGPIATPVLGDDLLYVVSFHPAGATEDQVQISFPETLKTHDKNGDGKLAADEVADVVIYKRGDAHGLGDVTMAQVFFVFDQNQDGRVDEQEFAGAATRRPTTNGLLAVRPVDHGSVGDEDIVWREKSALPESPSPLFYRGNVYTVKNGGILSCYDARTGKRHYRRRLGATGSYYASPVAGDGKVYLCSMNGVVTVLAAGDGFEKLGQNDLQETIMATPAIAHGTIYVRSAAHLRAFRSIGVR